MQHITKAKKILKADFFSDDMNEHIPIRNFHIVQLSLTETFVIIFNCHLLILFLPLSTCSVSFEPISLKSTIACCCLTGELSPWV